MRKLVLLTLLGVLVGCEKHVAPEAPAGVTQHVAATPAVEAPPTSPEAAITPDVTSVQPPAPPQTPAETTKPAGIDPTQLSNTLTRVMTWVDGWFLNTQIHAYAECTNVLAEVLSDPMFAVGAQQALQQDTRYAAVAAFIEWHRAADDTGRSNALVRMRETVTAQSWPFYMFALRHSPHDIARSCLMPPDELLSRIFPADSLWDAGLVGLGLLYRDCDSEEALINYWEEIRKRRPAVAGAAVVHQVDAARRMNDPDRVIRMLRENLDVVRDAQWTVERALWTLYAISHPEVPAISNALVAPKQ